MNVFLKFFTWIENLFKNPKVQAAFDTVAEIIQNAGVEQIVSDITALTPNKTVQEVTAAYEKYGIPAAADLTVNGVGAALLNLATILVQKKITNPVAVNLIQTAIQTVVTATKAAGL